MKDKFKYATYEQALLLKEKGFTVPCRYYSLKDGIIHEGFEHEHWGDNRIANWNRENIGIKPFTGFVSRPDVNTVVNWLFEKHLIWIAVNIDDIINNPVFQYNIKWYDGKRFNEMVGIGTTLPNESYSKAIDFVLKELI